MKKLTLILLFFLLLFSGFTDNQVWVRAKMPMNVRAGDRFTVEITINKLDLQHFAEFKQKLPDGFVAIEKQTGESDFRFSNQVVKFTWLRLPRAPKITVSYDVIVKENVRGQFSLPGQFTYIYKNQRGIALIQDDRINVFAKGEAINSEKFNEMNISFPPRDPNLVQCLRITPKFSPNDKAFIVKLLVSSGSIPSAAKIEEMIPQGFVPSIIDTKGATFSFENNKAVFIWKKMPDSRNFEILYKLVPSPKVKLNPAISGKLLYFGGGKDFSIPVKEIEQEKLNKSSNKEPGINEVYNFFNQ